MFATPAYAQAATGAAGGTSAFLIQIVLLILLFVIFWFLIIRPQQKRLKTHRDMVAAVARGDEVVTGGGLIGKVSKVTDTEVEIELAPTVKVRAVKSTLTSVTPKGTPAAANDAKA
ncbi:preprotein translocase subunit YajC [Sandaracinobacteroides saxicola]|uniref:Sec translocon accessory complex subunit YajC n=1 Tax=Sandaracinobacteroides saxicola TaxID=2759707 RepID=A0A7G5IID1_9SPHN|nr:preprotein translocase subunit YajC [Sandaracinobacteroides saxicola]QMW23123.1 preprotein translocase subunit YajC [Sandaracinobacteroides saxicola]